MSSIQDRKEEAKQFRKAGEYQKALEVYRSLFKDTKDQYDAAGFLHCLRKLGKFDEALPLAERIAQQ
jgi:tetratricopeptide (TPR) repeat protein